MGRDDRSVIDVAATQTIRNINSQRLATVDKMGSPIGFSSLCRCCHRDYGASRRGVPDLGLAHTLSCEFVPVGCGNLCGYRSPKVRYSKEREEASVGALSVFDSVPREWSRGQT